MKERFIVSDTVILYTNELTDNRSYYAAWRPDSDQHKEFGYDWDTYPSIYRVVSTVHNEVSEKWLLLRGYECRPPHLKK